MADLQNLLNVIRANASQEYQTRVPVATRNNISEVGNPLIVYSNLKNEFLNNLVEKIAMTIVRSKIAKNPLAILKKGSVPLGKDIEEIITNLTDSEEFDPNGTELLKRKIPDVKVLYHRLNRKSQYTTTITRQQLQTAFTSYQALNSLLQSIVNSLYSSDNYDEFILMKNLFADAITGNKILKVDVNDVTTNPKDLVKSIKTCSSNFVFPSSAFNKYSKEGDTKPLITWTPKENQILLIRSDVATEIDVEVLAVAFNLDKTTLLSRMLEVDSFGSASDCYAILCDESYVQVYDNLEELTSFYNPKGLYNNYYWNHWQTYSLSLFANAVAFMKKATV